MRRPRAGRRDIIDNTNSSAPPHYWMDFCLMENCGGWFGGSGGTYYYGGQLPSAGGGSGGGGSTTDYSLQQSSRLPPMLSNDLEYAKLHDEFLNSLLHEQEVLRTKHVSTTPNNHHRNNEEDLTDLTDDDDFDDDDDNFDGVNSSASTNSSWNYSPSISSLESSSAAEQQTTKSSSISSRKRRRRHHHHHSSIKLPFSFHNSSGISSVNSSNRRQQQHQRRRDPNLFHPPVLTRANTVHLDELPNNTKPPFEYLHAQVRLQKDKGKGDAVGSIICARGIDECLKKLRDKMHLLTEHCHEAATATMKRKEAKITRVEDNFVETRSLLILRMGFLSMTYGILVRWDEQGRIGLIVLRKNCHEAFYYKIHHSSSGGSSSYLQQQPPPLMAVSPNPSQDEEDDDDDDENEYPLCISVLYATGLSKRSHWTVQLKVGGDIESILLSYDNKSELHLPKLGGQLKCGNRETLELRLLEHQSRRRRYNGGGNKNNSNNNNHNNSTRTLKCTMHIPMVHLENMASMRIPCPDGATIQIEAVSLEIPSSSSKTKRQQQPATMMMMSPVEKARLIEPLLEEETENEEDVDDDDSQFSSPWDWICMVC